MAQQHRPGRDAVAVDHIDVQDRAAQAAMGQAQGRWQLCASLAAAEAVEGWLPTRP